MKHLGLITLLSGLLAISACNTMQGLGRDMSALGNNLEDTAREEREGYLEKKSQDDQREQIRGQQNQNRSVQQQNNTGYEYRPDGNYNQQGY